LSDQLCAILTQSICAHGWSRAVGQQLTADQLRDLLGPAPSKESTASILGDLRSSAQRSRPDPVASTVVGHLAHMPGWESLLDVMSAAEVRAATRLVQQSGMMRASVLEPLLAEVAEELALPLEPPQDVETEVAADVETEAAAAAEAETAPEAMAEDAVETARRAAREAALRGSRQHPSPHATNLRPTMSPGHITELAQAEDVLLPGGLDCITVGASAARCRLAHQRSRRLYHSAPSVTAWLGAPAGLRWRHRQPIDLDASVLLLHRPPRRFDPQIRTSTVLGTGSGGACPLPPPPPPPCYRCHLFPHVHTHTAPHRTTQPTAQLHRWFRPRPVFHDILFACWSAGRSLADMGHDQFGWGVTAQQAALTAAGTRTTAVHSEAAQSDGGPPSLAVAQVVYFSTPRGPGAATSCHGHPASGSPLARLVQPL
jgi:hypothetical protein